MEGTGMPPFAYAIIGGVVLLMIIVVVIGMKKSFGRARQANVDILSGLGKLGLEVTQQEGAKSVLQGDYRGRKVAMMVDGTALQKVGRQAMVGGLLAGAKGLAGVGGLGFGDDDGDLEKSRKMQDRVQNAAMLLKWAVNLPLDSPVTIKLSHDDDDGEELGDDLYGQFDEPARTGLTNPATLAAFGKAHFNMITVSGKKVVCTWAPPMKEYQQVASSSEAFAAMSQASLDALCTLCDQLYGPAA